MAVRTNTKGIAAAIAAVDPDAWVDIDDTADGVAQIAECTYGDRRLIVRRTWLTGAAQCRLWPDWRHFGFRTDLDRDVAGIVALQRDHATVEQAIRDRNEGAAMDHLPSGDFAPTAHGCSARCWLTTSSEPLLSPAPLTNSPSPARHHPSRAVGLAVKRRATAPLVVLLRHSAPTGRITAARLGRIGYG